MVKLNWLNKMRWLKWGKTQKLDFYADSVALLAGNEIYFSKKGRRILS